MVLDDCQINEGVSALHLHKLREWIPWITHLCSSWTKYYPFYLSLHLSEKAYQEADWLVRHLLRVTALEALFSSNDKYGYDALSKLNTFVGKKTDLYAQYHCLIQRGLPTVEVRKVLRDLCDLRNRVAHGQPTEPAWWAETRRRSAFRARNLNYIQELAEAAASLLSLVWHKILDSGLQDTFADKQRLRNYLNSHP